MTEPTLTIKAGPRFRRSARAMQAAAVLSLAFVIGLALLLPKGYLTAPFQQTLVLTGGMGSTADFFGDPKVSQILMRHHIRLVISQSGSREVAVNSLDRYDFAVTSGQPAGDQIRQERDEQDRAESVSRPFVSPLVFDTYRPYAQALQAAGIVQPILAADGSRTLYYRLDLDLLLGAMERQARWSDPPFNISRFGISTRNEVLPTVSDPCTSNEGESYVGLLGFALNGDKTQTGDNPRIDKVITSILGRQGNPPADAFTTFMAPEGRSTPLIFGYEHEYISYQLNYQAQHGHPDDDRVLLYPSPSMMSYPQFIALNPGGERLAALMRDDQYLQQREVELGLRPIAQGSGQQEPRPLVAYLKQQNLPTPPTTIADLDASLPRLPVLETMLHQDADCAKAAS